MSQWFICKLFHWKYKQLLQSKRLIWELISLSVGQLTELEITQGCSIKRNFVNIWTLCSRDKKNPSLLVGLLMTMQILSEIRNKLYTCYYIQIIGVVYWLVELIIIKDKLADLQTLRSLTYHLTISYHIGYYSHRHRSDNR